MGILDLFSRGKNEKIFVMLNINGRFSQQSKERNYDKPLGNVFKKYNLGEITGGGIYFADNGEPNACDIEIELKRCYKDTLISFLQELETFPNGSSIVFDDEKLEIGNLEGVAVYLNDSTLKSEEYASCDVNELVKKFDSAMEDCYLCWSGWEGSMGTALYFYGKSYDEMKEKMMPVIHTYPLCKQCRIEKIC